MTTVPSTDHPFVILVPYRDRLLHLQTFVPHMERFLARRNFTVIVVEQGDGKPFNRGALLNAGLLLAGKLPDFVVFHDVDMLPLNDSCDYRRPSGVCHLAGAAEQFDYQLPYANYLGGVLATTVSVVETINGFSNNYWGWGDEDDDLFMRLWLAGIPITRLNGRYRSLPHARGTPSAANCLRHGRILNQMALPLDGTGTIDPLIFHRVDPSTMCIPRPTAHSLCLDDGLSTLRYEVIDRRPLQEYCAFREHIGSHHKIVTVELLGDLNT